MEFITQASKETFPSLSGAPPFPTVVLSILDSSIATPLTAAFKESVPLFNSSPATVVADLTFHVATAKEL